MGSKTVFLAVFFIIFIIIAIVFPIPAPLLDILLTFSISYALTMLVLAILVKEPLEFSIFPTALLLGTLLRLSLILQPQGEFYFTVIKAPMRLDTL